MREVTENDFRLDEYKNAKIEDYEFRQDGQLVRKDRWEQGFRAIATQASLRSFEIHEVLLAVKRLVETRDAIRDIAQIAGVPCNCADVTNWARSMAERENARDANASLAPSVVDTGDAYVIQKDGNAWCATGPGFVDLQASLAGFGDTPASALNDLLTPVAEDRPADPAGEVRDVAEAIRQIKLAVERNSDMQKSWERASRHWHNHETIDDYLHDALAALGD